MRLARATLPDGAVGVVSVEGPDVRVIRREQPDAFDGIRAGLLDNSGLRVPDGAPRHRLADVRLLCPVATPSKVLAVGLNYIDHAREGGLEPPSAPVLFAKLPSSLVGPHDDIRYDPSDTSQVDYEAELAVVIGRRARQVAEDRALDYVLGYCAANDVSARDAQFADGQWIRGKGFDTFLPLGPWITTPEEIVDVTALRLTCEVDGAILQDGSTADMIFGVAQIISYASRFMTLEPGDVILTGTPAGVGFARTPPVFLTDGALVSVRIDQLGELRNRVVAPTSTVTKPLPSADD